MEIRTILGDGTESHDTEFDLAIRDRDGELYDPPVIIRCRTITQDERHQIQKRAEVLIPTRGRGRQRDVDPQKIVEHVIDMSVMSWTGIIGADKQPLVCNAQTKQHLPEHVKTQIIETVLNTEVVDLTESFREPAAVL